MFFCWMLPYVIKSGDTTTSNEPVCQQYFSLKWFTLIAVQKEEIQKLQ